MISNQRHGRANAPARAVRFSAILDDDDQPGGSKGSGISRVVGVVILMHIVAVGGIVAFKQIEEGGAEPADSVENPIAVSAPGAEPRRDIPGLAERRNDGKPVIFDHPTMDGYKRYRVGSTETLPQIARAFRASVSEVERLNSLGNGARLYAGQWLTVPDNREDKSKAPELIAEVSTAPKSQPQSKAAPKPVPLSGPVLEKIAEAAPSKPEPTEVAKNAPAPAAKPKPAPARTYKVISGDTAYRIALKYGISWQELLEENGMTDPRQLKAGQVIVIPASPVGGS